MWGYFAVNEETQYQLNFYLNTMKFHVLNKVMLKMCTPASTNTHIHMLIFTKNKKYVISDRKCWRIKHIQEKEFQQVFIRYLLYAYHKSIGSSWQRILILWQKSLKKVKHTSGFFT